MGATVRKPTLRTCEHCGRTEEWNDEVESWRVSAAPGEPFCIHEWDINGSFVPVDK
ncbi:HEWD family protein [Halalkaliarchaeum sp. AArc-GB]|uniref:HEWD family protein n=1 Tax=unclassified Halalkaliarchaeum TaxID=2678344 RepID=UPI00217EE508|nr:MULTISPECIES: HEWD family protein [unclassified Halalkaliarchaeum]MDR5672609.1 HEWD family protein [Halalkaliarchaeum sp. AArc-GB]